MTISLLKKISTKRDYRSQKREEEIRCVSSSSKYTGEEVNFMDADILLTKGKVLTVDRQNTVHEAVGIKDGKIIFCGSSEDAKVFLGSRAEVIDLNGRSVVPGFIESHIHSAVMGVNALAIDCRPSASFAGGCG